MTFILNHPTSKMHYDTLNACYQMMLQWRLSSFLTAYPYLSCFAWYSVKSSLMGSLCITYVQPDAFRLPKFTRCDPISIHWLTPDIRDNISRMSDCRFSDIRTDSTTNNNDIKITRNNGMFQASTIYTHSENQDNCRQKKSPLPSPRVQFAAIVYDNKVK